MYNASMLIARRRRKPWAAFILAGIILAAMLGVYLASPQLVGYSPVSEDLHVSAASPIRITFSEAMNQRSVELRFHVEPLTDGSFTWEGNTLSFQPSEPWPYQSEVVIRLDAGSRSERFLPMIGAMEWAFTTGRPRVVYLWPEEGPADLYARSLEEYQVQRLTNTPNGILDYVIAPNGFSIVYAALRSDGGSDIHLLNSLDGGDELILTCEDGIRCQNLAVSQSGILLFDEIAVAPSSSGLAAQTVSSVWGMALIGESTPYPISASNSDSTSASPSPAGWAAYYDRTTQSITIVESVLSANPSVINRIPNDLGLLGSWSPDGLLLLYPAITFLQESDLAPGEPLFYSHIYQTALPIGPSVDLSGSLETSVEDSSPVISPDGIWVAFTRKYLQQEAWTLGRQLWLMRADGSNSRQMTDEPAFTCSSPTWRYDSEAIVYVRVNEGDYSQPSEIWWLELESGLPQQLVIGGFLPRWIP